MKGHKIDHFLVAPKTEPYFESTTWIFISLLSWFIVPFSVLAAAGDSLWWLMFGLPGLLTFAHCLLVWTHESRVVRSTETRCSST